jgi:hypothetical protein
VLKARNHSVQQALQAESAFSTISNAVWFAAVSIFTVGYGDIVPVTGMGRCISAFAMLTGTLVIALPVSVVGSTFNIMYNNMADCVPTAAAIQEDTEIACATHLMPYASGMPLAHSRAAPVPVRLKDRLKLRWTEELAKEPKSLENAPILSVVRASDVAPLQEEPISSSTTKPKEACSKEQSTSRRHRGSFAGGHIASVMPNIGPHHAAEFLVRW